MCQVMRKKCVQAFAIQRRKKTKKTGIKSFSKCAKYKVIRTSVQLLLQTGLHTLV